MIQNENHSQPTQVISIKCQVAGSRRTSLEIKEFEIQKPKQNTLQGLLECICSKLVDEHNELIRHTQLQKENNFKFHTTDQTIFDFLSLKEKLIHKQEVKTQTTIDDMLFAFKNNEFMVFVNEEQLEYQDLNKNIDLNNSTALLFIKLASLSGVSGYYSNLDW